MPSDGIAIDRGGDTGPLETFAAGIEPHYRELAQRMERVSEGTISDDRLYM